MEHTFNLMFDKNWFEKGDVLQDGNFDLIILDTPKPYYAKWYWRILNLLTFRMFFNPTYSYKVKILN